MLATHKHLKNVLHKFKFYTKKDLWQNFLVDSRALDKIVDASPLYKEEVDEYHGILLLREVVTEVVSVTFEGGHEDFVMEQAQYQAFMDDHDSVLIYDNGIVRALERW